MLRNFFKFCCRPVSQIFAHKAIQMSPGYNVTIYSEVFTLNLTEKKNMVASKILITKFRVSKELS